MIRTIPARLVALDPLPYLLGGAVAAVGAVLIASGSATSLKFVFAGIIGLGLFVMVAQAPYRAAILALFLLPFLAFLRRIIEPSSTGLDPVVALPLVLAGVLWIFLIRGQHLDTVLSRWVTGYAVLLVVETLNPLQHGMQQIAIGFGLSIGLVFWFFIGRAVLNDKTIVVLRNGVVIVAVIVGLYGLKQTYLGFSSNEVTYLASRAHTYVALTLNGYGRPFSTLSNAAEYEHMLLLGAIAAVTIKDLRIRIPVTLFLLYQGFVAGSRGIFVFGFVGMVLALLMRRFSWRRAVGFTVVIVVFGFLGLTAVAAGLKASDASSFTTASIQRTVTGLADPFDPNTSTLYLHFGEAQKAAGKAVGEPIGYGSGRVVTTLPTKDTVTSETDVIDRWLALGYPGLLIFGAIAYLLFANMRRAWRLDPPWLLAALAPLAMFNAWFAAPEYSTTALLWVLIGGLDKHYGRRLRERDALAASVAGPLARQPAMLSARSV